MNGTCLVRYIWRLSLETSNRPRGDDLVPVVVFGAGEGGARSSRPCLPDPRAVPAVALLDDDPHKRRLRIDGFSCRGPRADLARSPRPHDAAALLIAIPSATAEQVRT